jgi:hypothetical protein
VPSYWFSAGSVDVSVEAYEEGNPFNQQVYLGLIVAGFFVLLRRRVGWNDIVRRCGRSTRSLRSRGRSKQFLETS